MTTIAWDGETLAADTRTCINNIVATEDRTKLFKTSFDKWTIQGKEIIFFGVAGLTGSEFAIQDLLKVGINPDTEWAPHLDFTAICVTKFGSIFIINKDENTSHPQVVFQKEPYAIGSGGVIARTAMLCGKTSAEAVGIAKMLDVYSGGRTETMGLK